METVGAYEAKTHLSKLLDQVSRGERILIERHGAPLAILQPADASKRKPAREAVDDMKRFGAGRRLEGLTIREMIDEGRR